ncbi:hypothetical protein TNCV_2308461 [Trichonephila clavipes]|nr:hypothetical protein TNCV_2308461 [Trichonephila clavipes]
MRHNQPFPVQIAYTKNKVGLPHSLGFVLTLNFIHQDRLYSSTNMSGFFVDSAAATLPIAEYCAALLHHRASTNGTSGCRLKQCVYELAQNLSSWIVPRLSLSLRITAP